MHFLHGEIYHRITPKPLIKIEAQAAWLRTTLVDMARQEVAMDYRRLVAWKVSRLETLIAERRPLSPEQVGRKLAATKTQRWGGEEVSRG